MRCMTVGLWPSGIFHFTILFTCYSFSDSLLLSYEDLGPFFTVLAPFGLICFPFRPKQASGPPFRDFVAFGLIRIFSFRRAEYP